ncbi:MAG: ligand-binding sensor domain-containing protein [Phycisphaerae bacterium]
MAWLKGRRLKPSRHFVLALALLVAASALLISTARSYGDFATAPHETPLNCPARFITAMVSDGHGGVWAAGEDTGICHGTFTPTPNHGNPQGEPPNLSWRSGFNISANWTAFNQTNSPGLVSNHIYSLCVDAKGRLWVGTDRHGVCVYNGKTWKHYGILTGPIGSHVIAITNDPRNHSVWMCSESGISIYQCSRHGSHIAAGYAGGGMSDEHATPGQHAPLAFGRWHYITGVDGLPASPDCVAFNKRGTAFVGTLCNGLAMAHYPYKHWRVIHGPWQLPRTAMGLGLPSNLINCVSVGRHGTVYVGTDLGLAISKNHGESFRYERGADYATKVLGLWHPPVGYQSPPAAFLKRLLPGDHITTVAQDALGNIWIGTWRNGYAVLNPRSGQSYRSADYAIAATYYHNEMIQDGTDLYVARLCPVKVQIAAAQDGDAGVPPCNGTQNGGAGVLTRQIMLIGRYGDGVWAFNRTLPARESKTRDLAKAKPSTAPLPQTAAAPTTTQLATLCKQLESTPLPSPGSIASVIPIGADWRTQGSWLGRYGRYWMCLFAADDPGVGDMVWEAGKAGLSHLEFIGPHCHPGDSVRLYHTWLFTHKQRVLQLPPIYDQMAYAMAMGGSGKNDRRESEIDDHGEAYSEAWQGPDVNVTFHIPKGEYTLSIYEFNKDGHTGANRARDYVFSAEGLPPGTKVQRVLTGHAPGFYDRKVLTAIQRAELISRGAAAFYRLPTSVLGRIVNFWGGVWHRILVRGPMVLLIRIGRNHSFNTILCGAALDPLNEHPAPYYYGRQAWRARLKQLSNAREALRRRWTEIRDTLPKVGEGVPSGYFANRLLRDEEFMLHENPDAWAASSQLIYTVELRRLMALYGKRLLRAKPGQLVVAARCAYRLELFPLWEGLEQRQDITTSRQIEKGLRWNQVYSSYRGLEFGVIRTYVKGPKAGQFAAAAN